MINFINKISSLPEIGQQPPLNSGDISSFMQQLKENNIASIPQDYLKLLQQYNGLNYNGGWLAGIHPRHNQFIDLCRLNIQVRHPLSQDTIILGVNDFDYMAFNHKWQVYQIIDKDDLEVLEEYQQIEPALNYILKI